MKRRLSAMSEKNYFAAETLGDLTIIRFAPGILLTGEIAQKVAEPLVDRIETQGCRRLVLNLANVATLSSLILAKLISLHKKMQPVGGRVVLCEAPEVIREILEVVQVTRL